MISFPTDSCEYLNFVIHKFLATEYMENRDPDDKYDSLDMFFSDDILREQRDQCLVVAEDLYYWTGDNYIHDMSSMHELALYRFLEGTAESQRKSPQDFYKIYYNYDDDRKMLDKLWDEYDKDAWAEVSDGSKESFIENVQNVDTMLGLCFEDTDFLIMPIITNLRRGGDRSVEEILGFDYQKYKGILPKDLQEFYEDNGPELEGGTLFTITKEMLVFIAKGIHKKCTVQFATALDITVNARTMYKTAPEHIKRILNQVFFEQVLVNARDDIKPERTPIFEALLSPQTKQLATSSELFGQTLPQKLLSYARGFSKLLLVTSRRIELRLPG